MFFTIFAIQVSLDSPILAKDNLINKGGSANKETSKILVAYYSYSGNTKEIANKIHNIVGGDIFEIQTLLPYSNDYNTIIEQGKKEVSAKYKPKLKNRIDNIEKYDTIFLGTPIWWYTIAPPVLTFLSEYDLSGKTIIPFCTHGGGGQSRSFADIKKYAPNSNVLEGIAFFDKDIKTSQNKINEWLQKLKFIDE
jgi:flavodoxin